MSAAAARNKVAMICGELMKKYLFFGIIVSLTAVLAGCGAHKVLAPPYQGVMLPPIPISVVLPPDSPISAADVSVARLTQEQALSQERAPSDLPDEFAFIEGFVLEPLATRFTTPARVRIEPEIDLPAGTRLFLFWVGSSRHGTAIDESPVQADGSVTFDTPTFGFFIVAENTLIPRPSDQFIVFGYTDIIEGAIPLTAHFRAVPAGGSPPYTFTWDFGDGSESASGETTAHTYLEAGEYHVSVEANDAYGRSATGSFTPIVATTEYTELSSVGIDAFPIDPGEPLRCGFFPSITGGVPPFTYEWSFGDGDTSADPQPEHLYPDYGLYQVHLTVTDAVDDSADAERVIDLRSVKLDAAPTFGSVPLEVTFTITIQGADPQASATLHFGDGNSAAVNPTAPTPVSHTYGDTGTYSAQLELTEQFGGEVFTKRSTPIALVALPPPVPYIYSIHPTQAAAGDAVSIYGQDFGIYHEDVDRVVFTPSLDAEILEWGDTIIRVIVPEGAEDGDVYVARGIYESNRHHFNVIEPGSEPQPPVIGLISPQKGPPGTQVAILGANFGDAQLPTDRVMLNNLDLEVLSWADTQIQAVIPSFAEDGDIVVYHQDLASNGYFFDVGVFPSSPPPVIISIDPVEGSPGTSVSIVGVGFGEPGADSMAFLGTTPMVTIVWSDTQILAAVPTGGGDGEIRVLRGGYFSNAFAFKVIPSPPNIGGLQQL